MTSLLEKFPNLVNKYWNFEKNTNVDPSKVSYGSAIKVWWKCDRNHEWQSEIRTRITLKNSGCPYCANKKVLEGFNDLASIAPEKLIEWDYNKNQVLPTEVLFGSNKKIWWICQKGHSWKASINRTANCPKCSKLDIPYKDSIAYTHPKASQYWDSDKNFPILPSEIKSGSGRSFYWKCKNGHEWKQIVRDFIKVEKCRFCKQEKSYIKFHMPELIKYSQYPLDIETETKSSTKKISWICNEGHKFDSKISSEYAFFKKNNRINCPMCKKLKIKKTLISYTDSSKAKDLTNIYSLGESHPNLIEYWDDNKNKDIFKFEETSVESVWWVCKLNHKWKRKINYQIKNNNCPYCTNRQVLSGFNDLGTTHPQIAKYWGSKNKTLTPQDVSYGSGKSVWWKCDKGHDEWKASILNRARCLNVESSCPICSNREVLIGFNDLKTTRPELIKEWDYEKNIGKNPQDFTYGQRETIWWLCKKNHSWQATIESRASGKERTNCPYCSKGNNSLLEKELIKFIKENLPDKEIITNSKLIIPPLELDIFIPSKKIAIEFNGLYWHSEKAGKDKNYHYNKWKACKDKGIQLITIWEDDWKLKKDIIQLMLKHKLGINSEEKVYARKLNFAVVNKNDAVNFLNLYHLQGSSTNNRFYGLFDNDEVLAVAGFRINQNLLYLDRYATKKIVAGGLGKILKNIESLPEFKNIRKIRTFANREVSNGMLYKKLNFTKVGELNPDYSYIYKNLKYHKFNFRKSRFKKDKLLKYKEGLTERELADLNNINRIWDSGKIIYERNFPQI